MLPSVDGEMVPEPEMRSALEELARDLALALQDETLRHRFHDRIQESRFAEGKLWYTDLLANDSLGVSSVI